MKLIAHRGNLNGPDPLKENSPEYIDEAINVGFDVEIDVRCEDHMFYLGHDSSQYYVPMIWLVQRKDKLWIHCKDLRSIEILSNSPVDFNYFWHQTDDYTLTSHNFIWTYPKKEYTYRSVIVMPEWFLNLEKIKEYECSAICSDYISKLKQIIKEKND